MTVSLTPVVRSMDLNVTGRSERDLARTGIVSGVITALVVGLILFALSPGVSPGGVLVRLGVVAVCALLAYRRPFGQVRVEADRRRSDVDLAVAVILDLVNIQTAGGAGIETALLTASSIGDGWAFTAIRECLSGAHASRTSYWASLRDLGATWGVSSLIDVANTGSLTGSHGARTRQSLISKAAALRARNLARVEHDAQQRTEQMGIPMVVLFVSFIAFLGYPALAQTVGSL